MEKEASHQEKGTGTSGKRSFAGVVVSDKMRDTVVVSVTRLTKHPAYRKYVKHTKRYKAHDPGNTRAVGDKVRIEECTPISKTKRFIVVQ